MTDLKQKACGEEAETGVQQPLSQGSKVTESWKRHSVESSRAKPCWHFHVNQMKSIVVF